MKVFNKIIIIASIITLLSYCVKEPPDLGKNPFENSNSDTSVVLDTTNWDPINIFSLHKDMFLPTCANSGCHDGNFEPDFRTVESSYYGLVNIKATKTRIDGGFEFRVKPGDANNSMLLYRLKEDLNGNSGIMPLGLEPNSDYPIHKDDYFQRIKAWIDAGAADMYGNLPKSANYPPVIKGIDIYQGGAQLKRVGVYEPISAITTNGLITVQLSLFDKEEKLNELTDLKVGLSANPDSFDLNNLITVGNMSPEIKPGLFGESVPYSYGFSFDALNWKENDVVWMRFYLTDQGDSISVPSETSMFFLKKYAAIRFIR